MAILRFIGSAAVCAVALVQAPPPARSSALFDSAQLLRDLRVLSADDMQGRQVGTPGGEKARAYVVERFRAVGLQPVGTGVEHPFTFRSGRGDQAVDRAGVNVVGLLPGRRQPAVYIVITAHYDHLGVRNGEVFNGADDNASGTAALFAVASAFRNSRPDHSLLFVALDAEESGLRGARAFVETPPVPREAMRLNINMDMIGRDPDDKLYVAGTFAQPFLVPVIEQIAKGAPVKLLMGHDNPNQKDVEDWTGASDHAAFCAAKIPCLYFGVEDFGQHHKATDDYDTMTHDFYVRVVETMVAVVRAFDGRLDEVLAKRGPDAPRR